MGFYFFFSLPRPANRVKGLEQETPTVQSPGENPCYSFSLFYLLSLHPSWMELLKNMEAKTI